MKCKYLEKGINRQKWMIESLFEHKWNWFVS